MAELKLVAAAEVADGEARELVANGRVFAVFRVGEMISVLDGICAHAGGPLGKGEVRGTVVTCPWHGWQYDVQSGRHRLTERICQRKYPARVEDGWIVIDCD